MLNIQLFVVNMIHENCYVVSDETNEAVIIDCGALFPEECDNIQSYIAENQLQPKHLLCTIVIKHYVCRINFRLQSIRLIYEFCSENVIKMPMCA